jgi:Domain of unknown function (DUF1707)
MAGSDAELAPGGAGRDRMLASREDRERVVEVLKAAYVQDRLTKDELAERVGLTLASRTYAELATVTVDLPAGLIPAPRKPSRSRTRPSAVKTVAAATLILPPPAVLGLGVLTQNDLFFYVFMLMIPWFFFAWIVAGVQILLNWNEKRSGGRLLPPSAQGPAVEPGHGGEIGDDLIRCDAQGDTSTGRSPRHGPRPRPRLGLTVP